MIDVEGKKDDCETPTHEIIWWSYPEIYDKKKLSTLQIELCHTRAADNIRIKYESDRDGWVIEQASIFEWDCDDEICDSDWQEVAFIKAWAREKNKDENQNNSQQTKAKIEE
jgi:hypothetical protein